MKYEKSAGVVVFRRTDDGIKYLLLYKEAHGQYKAGWDLPKGWFEKDEDEKETALRELKEETGISDVKPIDGFRETIEFFYKKDNELVKKFVVFYLGETKQEKVKLSYEHQSYEWMDISDVIATLRKTRKSYIPLFEKVHKFLRDLK